jgi:uncharacterized protein YlxW (UPF0749 family)
MDNSEEIVLTQDETLEQAEAAAEDKREYAPKADTYALQKSYKELQSAFTKKAQQVKELEQQIKSIPSRENIIREYLLDLNTAKPQVITSSSSAFDFAKEKKPTTLAQADKLAREYFIKGDIK